MERERLTITLRKDVLKLVDQSIDGAKLRNRSHAIEYFLSQSLSAKTLRAVLLVNKESVRTSYQAGGMAVGARGPLGDIKSVFQSLQDQSFNDVLLVGTDATSLQANVVDAEKYGLNAKTLTVPQEDVTLEQVSATLQDESFILWDTRFNGSIDLVSLVEFHKSAHGAATAALNPGQSASPIGISAQLYGQKIIGLGDNLQGGLPMAGVFVFEPVIFDERDKTKSLYRQILPALSQSRKLSGFVFVGAKNISEVEAVARI